MCMCRYMCLNVTVLFDLTTYARIFISTSPGREANLPCSRALDRASGADSHAHIIIIIIIICITMMISFIIYIYIYMHIYAYIYIYMYIHRYIYICTCSRSAPSSPASCLWAPGGNHRYAYIVIILD